MSLGDNFTWFQAFPLTAIITIPCRSIYYHVAFCLWHLTLQVSPGPFEFHGSSKAFLAAWLPALRSPWLPAWWPFRWTWPAAKTSPVFSSKSLLCNLFNGEINPLMSWRCANTILVCLMANTAREWRFLGLACMCDIEDSSWFSECWKRSRNYHDLFYHICSSSSSFLSIF